MTAFRTIQVCFMYIYIYIICVCVCVCIKQLKLVSDEVPPTSTEKKTDICIAPHSKELTAEVLRCGSHSFYSANTPHLPLPVAFHQRAPLLRVVIAAI